MTARHLPAASAPPPCRVWTWPLCPRGNGPGTTARATETPATESPLGQGPRTGPEVRGKDELGAGKNASGDRLRIISLALPVALYTRWCLSTTANGTSPFCLQADPHSERMAVTDPRPAEAGEAGAPERVARGQPPGEGRPVVPPGEYVVGRAGERLHYLPPTPDHLLNPALILLAHPTLTPSQGQTAKRTGTKNETQTLSQQLLPLRTRVLGLCSDYISLDKLEGWIVYLCVLGP